MNNRNLLNSGGSAAHSGIGYQDRVAAWFCVQALAEQEASPLWKWPSNTTIQFVRCETEQPVDDVMVKASHQGIAYINVKRSLSASQAENSDFSSALAQFTRQFIASINQIAGRRDWERPLNQTLDRFVLITPSSSSNAITRSLPIILDRLRTNLLSQGLDDAAQTVAEHEILGKVKIHLQREWLAVTGGQPTEAI